ncbi:hypothetical protein [Mycolicibacterium peregrinum]|nr:hypothetical protein [Mycolicibacterium peregrinum]
MSAVTDCIVGESGPNSSITPALANAALVNPAATSGPAELHQLLVPTALCLATILLVRQEVGCHSPVDKRGEINTGDSTLCTLLQKCSQGANGNEEPGMIPRYAARAGPVSTPGPRLSSERDTQVEIGDQMAISKGDPAVGYTV